MSQLRRISPCLWFDDQAELAARFYISIFPNSSIEAISYYGEAGKEIHGRVPGSVMAIEFLLDGERFTALNGGPLFRFSEAISFQVFCQNQDEIDYYWDKLSAGGDPNSQQCGWLKDQFGLSWQIVPEQLKEMMSGQDSTRSQRVMAALMTMKKLNLAELQKAYAG